MVMFRAAVLAAICGAVAGVIADLSWPLAHYMDDGVRCAASWVVLLMLVSISYCVGVWRGLGQQAMTVNEMRQLEQRLAADRQRDSRQV